MMLANCSLYHSHSFLAKKSARKHGLRGWCRLLLIFILVLGCGVSSLNAAKKEEPVKEVPITLMQYLVQEKAYLNAAIDNVKKSTAPKNEQEFNSALQQITASLTMNSAKIESLESFLDNQKKQSITLNQRLKYLQQLPVINSEEVVQEQVSKVEALLTINNKTQELIDENLSLANQLKILLRTELTQLQSWREHFDLKQHLKRIHAERIALNHQLALLYQNNLKSTSSKNKAKPLSPIDAQASLLINNQHVALIHHHLNALSIEKRVTKADEMLLMNTDIKSIQIVADIYKEAIVQCSNTEQSLQQMQNSLNKEMVFVREPSLKKALIALQADTKQQIEAVNTQKSNLSKKLIDYQTQLKKLISARQSLSEYSINSWPIITQKIIAIPTQCYKYVSILSLKVWDSYGWLNLFSTAVYWSLLGFCLLLAIFLRSMLSKLHSNKERYRLAGYLYDGVVAIIKRTMPFLCLYAMLILTFYWMNISFVSYQLLFNIINIALTFKILILIARLVLLERISDVSGKDVTLYHRLKWLFLFGGWSAALMSMSHLLPLAIILQDIFNRLFMLFILAFSLVVWKSKDVIPYLLNPLLADQKRYIRNAVSLLVILIPITLCSTAVIGLAGFINLAWTMSGYQAYILLLIVVYILVRGLVADALELLSEWMISSLENGWLWIEVFLKPIDKILRIVILLFIVFILFQIFGWNSDSLVMVNLEKIAQISLLRFTGAHITVTSVIEFFIVLSICVWAAKWTREFCYRWLYKNARDVGIRNSLSIFTQYAVILFGAFITLHVLGIDLSGMSMILGGLAVGMGFGLRDFASNIVGGIMLLIERPVREGDLITLGEHEGRVDHIGIRSMRVSSWDNMEVLIPNAETFNKPFTNWTLQDSIIRTVIPIKVCRSDDPVKVQHLILNILLNTPEVESDPAPQVFLKKIDEALIEFEARYFMNVHLYSRVEVRSNILFAITERFKTAGIRPPIEPVSVEIKRCPPQA